MSIFLHWLLSAVVLGVVALLVPGVEATILGALLAAAVLAVLSVFVKPILVLLTLPINIITLGLFSVVINTVLVLLAGVVVPGFSVSNFWWALLFTVILSLFNVVFGLSDKSYRTA